VIVILLKLAVCKFLVNIFEILGNVYGCLEEACGSYCDAYFIYLHLSMPGAGRVR